MAYFNRYAKKVCRNCIFFQFRPNWGMVCVARYVGTRCCYSACSDFQMTKPYAL